MAAWFLIANENVTSFDLLLTFSLGRQVRFLARQFSGPIIDSLVRLACSERGGVRTMI